MLSGGTGRALSALTYRSLVGFFSIINKDLGEGLTPC